MSLFKINPNLFILFILILLFSFSLSTKKIMILEGDQLDSQIKLASETNYKLFVLFYVNNCEYCNMALKILKTQVIKNFEDEDEISFGSINLDEQKNVWFGLRFNVTKIPYIILIENKKMYLYQKNFESKEVIKFINEEKNIEDALDIPDEITFFTKFKAAMRELGGNIEKILEKFGVSKTYGLQIAYFLIIMGFISFIYLENKLLDLCRRRLFNKEDTNLKNTQKEKEIHIQKKNENEVKEKDD